MRNRKPVLLFISGLLSVFQTVNADTLEHHNCNSVAESPGSSPENTTGMEKESFMRSYAVAECFIQAAESAGALWLKTEQLLQRSFEEAENNHWDEAMESVTQARFQAETALQQADREALAWERRVIRNKETGN